MTKKVRGESMSNMRPSSLFRCSICVFSFLSLFLAACTPPGSSGTQPGAPPASSDKEITQFWFDHPGASGAINQSLKTISVPVPFGTDVRALIARFTTSGTSVRVGTTTQESGATPNDFSSPVSYVVVAADGTAATYVVTVVILNTTTRGVISAIAISGTDLYAGGTRTDSSVGPGYWLNNVWTLIVDPFSAFPWGISSIAVPGAILTLGGTKVVDSSYNAHYGYWASGVWHDLWTVPTGGTVLCTLWSGTNLYAGGLKTVTSVDYVPGYWLNGTWVGFTNPGGNGQIEDLKVVGTDVYAAGWINPSTGAAPGYWINGAWTPLSLPPDSTGYGRRIAVSGSDIYVSGERIAAGVSEYGYWLNGNWNPFSIASGTFAFVSSAIVSGGNAYFCGFLGNVGVEQPGYWLGTTWVPLSLPPYATGAKTNCIVVSGSDIYVGGYGETSGGTLPGYWKNGTWVGL